MKQINNFTFLLSPNSDSGGNATNTIRMNSGQRLDEGQAIGLLGKGKLTLQADGNLVLLDVASQPKWTTGTGGKAATHVIMQTDGNLVIYNGTTPIWASDTWGGANSGGYFEINMDTWSGNILKADGALVKTLFAGSVKVNLSEGITITGKLDTSGITTAAQTFVKFPRGLDWESKLCAALGLASLPAPYGSLTAFQQAIGSLGLDAAEATFQANKQTFPNPQKAMESLSYDLSRKYVDAVIGVLGTLIITKLKENKTDAQSNALRDWATEVYRKIKVDAAIGTLKEYQKWKNNPCTYSATGYVKPQDCFTGKNPYHLIWKTSKPPLDLLYKAGLAYACGNNDLIVKGVFGALTGIGTVAGFAAVTTGVGVSTGVMNVETGGAILTCLYSAFGGTSGTAGSAAGAIGAAGWGGVAAGPAAIIVSAVVIGISHGIAVIEGEQAENRLRQAIRVALQEHLNMANILADNNNSSLFLVGMVKSAQKGWQAPPPDNDGEVTFFNEAGYVSKFYLNYTQNGQPKSLATKELGAGYSEIVVIPANAKNIMAKGVMISAGEHQVFNEAIERPTYICFKTYGTVFKQGWNNDWPLSVGGEVSTVDGRVKFIHSAGFVANFQITYDLPGKPQQSHNPTGKSLGWTDTYDIPKDATNITILIQGATGLVWEPWRNTYSLTFPTPPNLCIKIYGTSLDQKWNNDCN